MTLQLAEEHFQAYYDGATLAEVVVMGGMDIMTVRQLLKIKGVLRGRAESLAVAVSKGMQTCYQLDTLDAKAFNRSFKVGTTLLYRAVRGQKSEGVRVVTASEAWALKSGELVVKVGGMGCIATADLYRFAK
jgi:hypothetical protein